VARSTSERAELERALERWQVLFGLQDWKIKLRLTSKADDFGEITWREDERRATLTVSTAYPAKEATIVHELIELMLGRINPTPTPAQKTSQEWAIRKLERAFAVLADLEYGR